MKHILIIEDDANSRQMAQVVLEQAGYQTSMAENGHRGLELAETLKPDLILSDIMMDVMDGYSFLEALRHAPATATIPVILMTGLSSHESMRKGMDLGADDYLAKPISVPELLQSVRTRLAKHKTIVEKAESKLDTIRKSLHQNLPHELNTPLSTLLGVSHLLRLEGPELAREEVVEMAGWIHDSALRLQHLFENFLFLHHLDMLTTDEQEALAHSLPLTLTLPIEEYGYQVAHKHERLDDLSLDLVPAAIRMEEQYFKKLFIELLDNAFKFSDAGQAVRVHLFTNGEEVKLAIADKGLGIKAEQIKAIDVFQQFERDVHEQQGLGLGLTITQRILKLHKGQLQLSSVPAQGTTATVVFSR